MFSLPAHLGLTAFGELTGAFTADNTAAMITGACKNKAVRIDNLFGSLNLPVSRQPGYGPAMFGGTVGQLLQLNVAKLIFIEVKSVFQQSQSDICFIDYHLHSHFKNRKRGYSKFMGWGL